jgi:glycosyltransferase involved in cell wall biosynthesis
MSNPLLTIITRTCKRPRGLARAVKSVLAQTCKDWEQIFIVDKIGRHEEGNIPWANRQFAVHAGRVDGDYVFPLDDDGMLIDTGFVKALQIAVAAWNGPEAFLVKTLSPSKVNGAGVRLLPEDDIWHIDWESGERPSRWSGNGYCLVTRVDIWKARVEAYYKHDEPTGGDWHFCTSLIESGCQFVRLDICASRSLSRGKGRKFETICPPDWFEKTAAALGIKEVAKGDWRLRG